MYRRALLLFCIFHDENIVGAQQGCFSYNYLFYPAQSSNLTVGDARECQGKCRETAGCQHFTYWKRNGMCLLAAENANLVRTAVEGSVTGPAACMPNDPVCSSTTFPDPDFPAPTATRSRKAWPGGQQPTNLQCWPRRADGFPEPCPYQQVEILEDTLQGWPGRCENMRKVVDLRPGETCKMRCFNSALCGVWRVENFTTPGVPTCWQALHATNCFSGDVPPPIRAQRVMHGSFRKLMESTEMFIKNLSKAFDTKDVGNNKTEGGLRCRRICLSYLFCQYWQYSTKLGCWVEDPAAKEVAYPMIKESWAMEIDSSVIMGEYIQHTCMPGKQVPFPTDPPGMGFLPVSSPSPGVRRAPSPGAMRAVKPVESSDSRTYTSLATGESQGGIPEPEVQPVAQKESVGIPLWLKVIIVLVIALCLAAVAGGVYWVMMGHKKGARRVSGERKAGPSKRSQRTEPSFESPSMGNMNSYGEQTAWQQGETVPFMQNQGSQGCYGQRQQQRGNYGNSFPQPQQGYLPTQPQMYQPMQQQGCQGYM